MSLKGIISDEFYENGYLKECLLNEKNEIETPLGKLTPIYEDDGVRDKYNKSLSFYENGEIKSISLQERQIIKTSIGSIPAELLTFYQGGGIKRIFPLNGKITGFWTEDDEYNLAKEVEIKLPFGTIKKKVASVQFYESGNVKSITLWGRDNLEVTSPIGEVKVRNGISFYETGEIKSLEPFEETFVDTPIGKLKAYSNQVLGIHGETNSLGFFKEGGIESLTTLTNQIEVTDKNGDESVFTNKQRPSLLDLDLVEIVPLSIEFYSDKVRFNNDAENDYEIQTSKFIIREKSIEIENDCSNCAECSGCY